MIGRRLLLHSSFAALVLTSLLTQAQTVPSAVPNPRIACGVDQFAGTSYRVSLRDRNQHILKIEMSFDATRGRELQMPVWNALYQVRDFSQYVRKIEAHDADGPLPIQKLDKTTWRVDPAGGCAIVEYEIFANEGGPFSAQVNGEHAFLNWAQVLMYPTDSKAEGFAVRIVDAPADWKLRDGGIFKGDGKPEAAFARSGNYDQLVDSPVELGQFAETTFVEGGGSYRVVVHADAADYDMNALTGTLRKIVATTVEWMRETPTEEFTFIYHLPRGPAGGGMEHANSTAIDVNALRMKDEPLSFASVSAHEFFHYWNVKRLRPQSLEPVDYTRENYTRALWFCEGVTSTVAEHMLYRAGLVDEQRFLSRLSGEIAQLDARPARLTQSVEESSLDTWLDKYAHYRQADRSINYYNKGHIVGELLDLRIRAVTGGRRSLRDVMLWMNDEFAKKRKFYPDSDGVQLAAETITGESFDEFFERFVAGTEEIPYEYFFSYVGLRPIARTVEAASLGFTVNTRNFGQQPTVASVDQQSEAQKAGIIAGDSILAVNGVLVTDINRAFIGIKPGDPVKLKIRSRGVEREVKLKMGSRQQTEYVFVELDNVTPEQKMHRAAWLRFESETPGGKL